MEQLLFEANKKIISEVIVNRGNFEHISKTGNINGSLQDSLLFILSKKDNQFQDFLKWIYKEGWQHFFDGLTFTNKNHGGVLSFSELFEIFIKETVK